MAKKKIIEMGSGAVIDMWAKLKEDTGLSLLEDIEPVSHWIDTGILALNFVCSGKFIGGGVPSGKIIEIYGDSATGKSLIGTNILKGAQTCGGIPILLDAERAVSKEFAKKASKIDAKKFFVMEADTLEGCFNKIYTVIRNIRATIKKDIPIVICYDSIASSASEREFAETELDLEKATKTEIKEAGAGADKPGERAKICSKELRKLPAFLKENNATLIVINQVREKIGIMFGSNIAMGGGGRALEYYASLRLSMRANRTPRDAKGNVMGVNVSIRNEKNRCFRPFVEAKSMYLFFEQGINPFGGLLELMLQFDRIKSVGPGRFEVLEPWAGGKEIKFTSSKERNDIPVATLLECPALIDAETPEQVQYYIDLYQSAIDAVDSGIATEEEIKDGSNFNA